MEKYRIENYTDPWNLYKKISNKLKLGHLVLDTSLKKFRLVDLKLLEEIVKSEGDEPNGKSNFIIPDLTKEWLEKIFDFNSKFNAPNNMTVFTSNRHGIKIHESWNGFSIGITVREKSTILGMTGTHVSKPRVLNINELLDYMFLLKRDEMRFDESDIEKINSLIKV